jgi:hypothetical protein
VYPTKNCLLAKLVRSLARAAGLVIVLVTLWPAESMALPIFARQTGQNCLACHAGGQFPELTPYGRLFKLTGYTLGKRTIPLAAMVVMSASVVSNTSKSDDPAADFQKNKSVIIPTASVFLAGKVTDNIGAFIQITYDNFAGQSDDGKYYGHSSADNMEIRYADRHIDEYSDLIYGVSLNNNPSLPDPWNTAGAWMQYVPVPSPTSSSFIDGNTPYPGLAAGGNIAGITAYGYWNQLLYVELGGYGTANGLTSFMSAGVPDDEKTHLQGTNPYWRVALSHFWGANNIMVGTSGMSADVYDDPLDTSDPNSIHHLKDIGFDSQYQYLLDPHSVTAQLAYMRNKHSYPGFLANQPVEDVNGDPLPDTNANDTTKVLRAKVSYVYGAKYGGSLAHFNQTGTTNSALYDPTRVFGNVSGSPDISGWTVEAFWTPIQYIRIGAQYTSYSKFNGASNNYDGFGRNAGDNNSLFFYIWGAY